MSTATIINGDARRLPLADGSVHCVITSPPYWGLRDYGTAAWEGGDEGCDHDQRRRENDTTSKESGYGGQSRDTLAGRDLCRKCGARRVDRQIGLEATPDEFVATMVRVFREVKRVLRDDGTAWVNLGDSYVAHGMSGGTGSKENGRREDRMIEGLDKRGVCGVASKNLLMMPHRVALALQADGWIVRSDIVWAKPNPMPESVTDRPTKSHEYVFLMAKRERYFFDADAVREKQTGDIRGRVPCVAAKMAGTVPGLDGSSNEQRMKEHRSHIEIDGGRNLRSVWTIPTHAWPGSHFATFPPELVRRCVKAGTSEKGCCPMCGAGWERVVEKELVATRGKVGEHNGQGRADKLDAGSSFNWSGGVYGRYESSTLGFRPSCSCPDHAPIPCTVLDPFAGSGTTGVVATGLNRRFVGVELSPEYCRMAVRRISRPHASHRTARAGEALPLFP